MASHQKKDSNQEGVSDNNSKLMSSKNLTLPTSLPALDEFIEKEHIRKTMEEMMDNQPTFDHYLEKIKSTNTEMMFPPVAAVLRQ